MILALLSRDGLTPLQAQIPFNLLEIGVIFFCLKQIGRDSRIAAWPGFATILLIVNPLLLSTSGLETYLFIALLLLLCVTLDAEDYIVAGLCAAALILTRADGGLAVVLALAWIAARSPSGALKFFSVAASVVAVWLAFSWIELGSLLPDTYFIKRGQSAWGEYHFLNGLALYARVYPWATAASFALLPLLLCALPFAARAPRPPRAILLLGLLAGLGGALHFLAYSLMRVPPYHWYYGWECAATTLLGSLALFLVTPSGGWPRAVALAVLAAVAMTGALISASAALRDGQMPIHSNWGTTAQYRKIAEDINRVFTGDHFHIDGELGVIQYYSKAEAVNEFSDREILRDIQNKAKPGALSTRLLAANFAWLKPRGDAPSPALLSTTACGLEARATLRWTTGSTWRASAPWCWLPEGP